MIHDYIYGKLTGSTLSTVNGNIFNEYFDKTFDFTQSDAIIFELRCKKMIVKGFYQYELNIKIMSDIDDNLYTIKDSLITLLNGDYGDGQTRYISFEYDDLVYDNELERYTLILTFQVNYEKM